MCVQNVCTVPRHSTDFPITKRFKSLRFFIWCNSQSPFVANVYMLFVIQMIQGFFMIAMSECYYSFICLCDPVGFYTQKRLTRHLDLMFANARLKKQLYSQIIAQKPDIIVLTCVEEKSQPYNKYCSSPFHLK